MDPIALDEKLTLVVDNFASEDSKIPFDSPATYIGRLKDGNAGYVYAATLSAAYYCLFICPVGIIGKPIPREFDTFAKLRQWCLQEIKNQEEERMRLEMLWKSRVEKIEKKLSPKKLAGIISDAREDCN